MAKWHSAPETFPRSYQRRRLRSDAFFWIGVGCLGASAALQAVRKPNVSSFIRQWAPPLLMFGLYEKVARALNHDRRMAA